MQYICGSYSTLSTHSCYWIHKSINVSDKLIVSGNHEITKRIQIEFDITGRKNVVFKNAPFGNRTRGKRLEGVYVTTTPMVLMTCVFAHFESVHVIIYRVFLNHPKASPALCRMSIIYSQCTLLSRSDDYKSVLYSSST